MVPVALSRAPYGFARSGALRLFHPPTMPPALTLTGASYPVCLFGPKRQAQKSQPIDQTVEQISPPTKGNIMNGVTLTLRDDLTGVIRDYTFECHTPERLAHIVTTTTAELAVHHSTLTAINVA